MGGEGLELSARVGFFWGACALHGDSLLTTYQGSLAQADIWLKGRGMKRPPGHEDAPTQVSKPPPERRTPQSPQPL